MFSHDIIEKLSVSLNIAGTLDYNFDELQLPVVESGPSTPVGSMSLQSLVRYFVTHAASFF